MAGDINVYESAANSGTEWDNLADALSAASSGDVIEISGSWSANDSSAGNAVSLANLTIRAVGDAKYVPGSTGHYVLNLNSGTQHGINFTGTGTLEVEGFEIYVNTTTTSREAIRFASSGTLNVKSMYLRAANETNDQDGIYSYHDYGPTINVENTIIYGFHRGGVHYQAYTNGQTNNPTINVVSSTILGAGGDFEGGCVIAGGTVNGHLDMDVTINVQDSLCGIYNSGATYQNTIGVLSQGIRVDQSGDGTHSVNIDNTIVTESGLSDTSAGIDSFTNSLAGASLVETATGTGTEVVFVDLTTAPYDFSLVDDADNDAQDYHSDAGLLLTIPSTDIVGTSRPQNTDYDLGAFEISAGAGPVSLIVQDATHSQTADAATLTQAHGLAVNGADSAQTVDSPTLSQAYTLVPADTLHGHLADEPTLSAFIQLSVNAADQSVTVDQATLTQANQLAPNDATHAHSADQPVLSGAGTLDVASADHAVTVAQATLTQANLLSVADALHGHTADPAALTQAHLLVVQSSDQAQTADNVTLTLGGALDVASALHGHLADLPTLTQAHTLQPASADSTQTVDSPTLSEAQTLAVADATHVHSTDQPTLDLSLFVDPAGSTHATSSDSPSLTQAHVLAVNDALQSVGVDPATLSQGYTIIVNDALHEMLAGSPTLYGGQIETPDGRIFLVSADARVFLVSDSGRYVSIH